MAQALADKISDARLWPSSSALQGRQYALNGARFAIVESRRFRAMGNAHQAHHYARQAARFRAEAVRATTYHALTGRPMGDTMIDWVVSQEQREWLDHTAPTSRERAVRVERDRLAYRASLSGRHA